MDWAVVGDSVKFEDDYTVRLGTLLTKSSEGTKYIEIPIVVDAETEGFESFNVILTKVRGANIEEAEAVVMLYDTEAQIVTEELGRVESPVSVTQQVDDNLTSYNDRLFVDESIALRYSTRWQGMVPFENCTAQILARMDGVDEERVLFRSDAGAEGMFEWNSLNLDEGNYRLTHQIIDEDRNVIASTSTYRYLLQNGIKMADELKLTKRGRLDKSILFTRT